ncbi:hypothetical protein AURDEDRAFT_176277 [Auricularia subglabra TFB-10046 SS5]|uniref:Uncharacterized protein n=1 Tax=Auricularia subglabra (strain TFB-10046 / SS5) TaxID=717982 RepID=J0WQB3_AURST|nr:hypothetical protein AURDEDRAFT_176277 [Auricularia subglabra TFB-10046 SS5]
MYTIARTLLPALFAYPLARASFVEPIVTFDESDPRVQCSPPPGALTCAGLENCQQSDSWWAVDGKDYHGGRMLAIDSPASCTSITFYGLRIENGANGTYAVDGSDRTPFTWGITNERLGGGVTSIFRAAGLRFGKHVLEFTVDAVKGTLASVDFFAVTDPSLEKDVPQPSRPGGFVVTHNFVPGAEPTIPPTPPTAPIAPVPPVAPALPISPVSNIAVPESSSHSQDDFFSNCSPFVVGALCILAVVVGAGVLFTVSRRVRRLVRRARRGRRGGARDEDEKTVVFDEGAEEEGKPLLKE